MVRKLRIREAFGDRMLQDLRDFVEDELSSRFEGNLAQKASNKVKSYNPDWFSETETKELKNAREKYIDEIMYNLISNG